MRAIEPAETGVARSADGVRIAYEVFGPGESTILFLPSTPIVHSRQWTKQIEDAAEWAVEGSIDAMIADSVRGQDFELDSVEATCRAVRCPMLLVHGSEDHCQPVSRSRRLSELTGAPLVVVDGADHMIPGRHPVLANLLIRDFVRSLGGKAA